MGYRTNLERDIDRLRGLSGSFMMAMERNDDIEADNISQSAWPLLRGIVNEIRQMREHKIVSPGDDCIVGNWITPKKAALSFKDALDKIIHHNPSNTEFRMDGRKHYLIFSGEHNRQPWRVEIGAHDFINACQKVVAGRRL